MTSPPKGLLPQIVEVLYALSDSQELLTNRIRAAHLELIDGIPKKGAWPLRPLPLNPSGRDALLLVARAQVRPQRENELLTTDVCDASRVSPAHPGDSTWALSPQTESGGVILEEPESVTPTNTPTNTETPADKHDDSPLASPIQPDGVRATNGGGATMERQDRGYNYFDELDARLDDLGKTENGNNGTQT